VTESPFFRVPDMTDWSQIVEEHGPLVWRVVYRLVSNEADAADCFQDTFLSVLELSNAEPVRHWPALLRRLATARALERLRQRYRATARQSQLAEAARSNGKSAEPHHAAEVGELAEHLRTALTEIDERQAEVFCLACLEDLTYDEIASQLGITVNHVGVLLNRAKVALRERLAAHAPAETQPRREAKP
jgi:RNA polymerase sigma-70 factor (ECF subfamily)